MKLNWNDGINRLILLVATIVGVPWGIYSANTFENPLAPLIVLPLLLPFIIGGCLLLLKIILKVLALWIKSGFTKSPK